MQAAVIGCGSIGLRHIRNLRAEGLEVVAFDPDAERRRAAADAGATTALSLGELWDHAPPIAVVATPTARHVEDALVALEHGCDVLIEKPLADRLDGLAALEHAAEGRVVLVGCNMRFHPGPALVHRLAGDGALGEVVCARFETGSYLPHWRPGTDWRRSYSASAAAGGGAVLDCIHELDLALWMFGPARLAGAATLDAATLGLDVEGTAELLLLHDSGALSSVHLSVVRPDYHRSCVVVGADASASWDWQRGTVEVRTGDGEETLPAAPEDTNAMYVDELRYFLDCVERRTPTCNEIAEAGATLALALAAREQGAAA